MVKFIPKALIALVVILAVATVGVTNANAITFGWRSTPTTTGWLSYASSNNTTATNVVEPLTLTVSSFVAPTSDGYYYPGTYATARWSISASQPVTNASYLTQLVIDLVDAPQADGTTASKSSIYVIPAQSVIGNNEYSFAMPDVFQTTPEAVTGRYYIMRLVVSYPDGIGNNKVAFATNSWGKFTLAKPANSNPPTTTINTPAPPRTFMDIFFPRKSTTTSVFGR